MKYRGKRIEGRNVVTMVIPRPDGNIAFIFEAVESFDRFDELCKPPEPPEVVRPGNIRTRNIKDPKYLKRLTDYAEKRSHYMVLKSLEATKDLEWETVDIEKPETFTNWTKELMDCGFTDIEVTLLVKASARANCLDQDMLDDARSTFLQEQARQSESSSQKDEPQSI